MSCHRVDLGKQALTSAKAKLQLECDAYANLTCPETSIMKLLKHPLFPLIPFRELWISRRHNLQLSFSISFDARFNTSPPQEESLVDHIGQILESAELWQQLSLIATSTRLETNPALAAGRQIGFTLTLQPLLNNVEGTPQGSLLETNSFGEAPDLQPPIPVPTLVLLSVEVFFRLSPMPAPNGNCSTRYSQSHSTSTSSGPSLKGLTDLSTAKILPLIDKAVRNLFCPRPIRPLPGIRSSHEVCREYLADLAPQLFVPGYIRNVAGRASFIPAIAKALTSVINRTDNKNFQRRVADLIQQSSSESTEYPGNHMSNMNIAGLNLLIRGHFWLTLTNVLRSMEPSRRLKPLRALDDDVAPSFLGHEYRQALPGERNFDISFSPEPPVFANYETVLLPSEDEESELEDKFLFDVYDTSRTYQPTEHVEAIYGFCEDETSSILLDVEHEAPVETVGCDLDNCFDADDLLATAHSAADPGALFLCLRSGYTSQKEQAIHGSNPTSGVWFSLAPESVCCINPNEEVRTPTGEDDSLTQSPIRQHPAKTLSVDDNHSDHTTWTLFEDTDRQVYEDGQLDTSSIVSQMDQRSVDAEAKESCRFPQQEETHILIDTDMATEAPISNISSEIFSGDYILGHMWKQRSNVTPNEDVEELCAMHSADPDMRLMEQQATRNEDEEMLDDEPPSTNLSNSCVIPPASEDDFSCSRWQSSDRFPSSPSSNSTSRPRSKDGQSFLKRLSMSRTSSRRTSTDQQIQYLINAQPREVEIKRRKTLKDYEMRSSTESMLL